MTADIPKPGPRRRATRPAAQANPATQARSAKPSTRQHHPLLDRLAVLHPQLFGRRFMPLKIGIFEDLVARHGDQLPSDELKAALAEHTRSTRYLDSVARLQPRCDLDGQPTEPVAVEHVHYAIIEILRRRLQRAQRRAPATSAGNPAADPAADPAAKPAADAASDTAPDSADPAIASADHAAALDWARQHLAAAIEASGLDRAGWADKVRTQDARALALAEEAFSLLSTRQARRDALLRAYDASGRGVDEFAQMYGMDVSDVSQALAWRARQRGLVG